jgi:hypothetical protein
MGKERGNRKQEAGNRKQELRDSRKQKAGTTCGFEAG